MLYGRYDHVIDSKNRVFVPAKYKEALGDSFKLSHNGFNKCILVYSNEEWAKYEERLSSYPQTEFEDYIREVYSNTVDILLLRLYLLYDLQVRLKRLKPFPSDHFYKI